MDVPLTDALDGAGAPCCFEGGASVVRRNVAARIDALDAADDVLAQAVDPLGELIGEVHDSSGPKLIDVLSDGQKLVPSSSPHVDISLAIPLGLLVPCVQGPDEIFVPCFGILRPGHGGCVSSQNDCDFESFVRRCRVS